MEEASNLTLKRGSGLVFEGSNWSLSSERNWTAHKLMIPTGNEPFVGFRSFDGVEHAIFLCSDDEYFAQPKFICEAPQSENPFEKVYSIEIIEEIKEKPKKKTQVPLQARAGIMQFNGKNWKLAGDKKWTKVISFLNEEKGASLGSRIIGNTEYDVFQGKNGFFAIKR